MHGWHAEGLRSLPPSYAPPGRGGTPHVARPEASGHGEASRAGLGDLDYEVVSRGRPAAGRRAFQAAAASTSTFAATTGGARMSTP